ncbi:MAG: hypothetical protein ACSNEK_00680 [Parachlamydiaceae bacterium]
MITIKPAAYLPFENKRIDQSLHAALIFLQKQLRKQIKLATKQKKIAQIAPDAKVAYLRLTWMHGTTAATIKSACQSFEHKLVPSGQLKKQQTTPLTGEMCVGSTSLGVNKRAISGVNLPQASVSINYAENYLFSFTRELNLYRRLLARSFSSSEDFWTDCDTFSRFVVALKRVQLRDSELFEIDREKWKNKLEEIYLNLDRLILSQKHTQLKNDSHIASLYVFLNTLEELKSTIETPSHQADDEDFELVQIPVILASHSIYGEPAPLNVMHEPPEEICRGSIQLGKDIQYIFTLKQHIDQVQALLEQYGLLSVKVKTIDKLEAASRLDRELGPYFYDAYSIKKWRKSSQA